MTVIAYRDRTTGRYPITLAEIRSNASVLFGDQPDPWVLDEVGADPVETVDPPVHDTQTETLTEDAPVKVSGKWRQTWNVAPLPPAPVPEAVTMRQAKIQLSRAGKLSAANSAIEAMPGQPGEEARIEWTTATLLRRDHPLVAGLGAALGLDASAIDNLFKAAATIQ